jgi:hypothetical protein
MKNKWHRPYIQLWQYKMPKMIWTFDWKNIFSMIKERRLNIRCSSSGFSVFTIFAVVVQSLRIWEYEQVRDHDTNTS